MGRVPTKLLERGKSSLEVGKRQIERTTGIPFPDEDAPDDAYCQCLVAQIMALLHLGYEDATLVESEALKIFMRSSSFERYRPYLEKALGSAITPHKLGPS